MRSTLSAPTELIGLFGQTMPLGTIFYADILGFAGKARIGEPAMDALSDLALILSSRDEISKLLQEGAPWLERLGLSDSIFLVADDAVSAARAAAELFYHLAYLNASRPKNAVMLRGGVVTGKYEIVPPIFAESATKNLVGAGVVAAVRLESSGVKGPRLLLDQPTAALLETSNLAYALRSADVSEMLWPIIDTADGIDLANLRSVFCGACHVILEGLQTAEVDHFIAYAELIARCFERLGESNAAAAAALASACPLKELTDNLTQIVERQLTPADRALRLLRSWAEV
jgi:hypothetical protein